jgi:hypothetical protein
VMNGMRAACPTDATFVFTYVHEIPPVHPDDIIEPSKNVRRKCGDATAR